MENEHISSLFQKIRERISRAQIDRKKISEIFQEVANIKLNESDISYKKGILVLKISPIKRNEVVIKKNLLLERIKKETRTPVSDIR